MTLIRSYKSLFVLFELFGFFLLRIAIREKNDLEILIDGHFRSAPTLKAVFIRTFPLVFTFPRRRN
jgi:hypothetical protein